MSKQDETEELAEQVMRGRTKKQPLPYHMGAPEGLIQPALSSKHQTMVCGKQERLGGMWACMVHSRPRLWTRQCWSAKWGPQSQIR